MICGSGGSKRRLSKAAGAEPAGQMRDEKLHTVVARSTFQVKRYKTPQLRSTFRSCAVEKVHAVVARSTFPSENVQNTPFSDHFWQLRCRKRLLLLLLLLLLLPPRLKLQWQLHYTTLTALQCTTTTNTTATTTTLHYTTLR